MWFLWEMASSKQGKIMRLVDIFGNDVPLEDLEPWTHFLEHDGKKAPIIKVTYGYSFIQIDWQREHENRG